MQYKLILMSTLALSYSLFLAAGPDQEQAKKTAKVTTTGTCFTQCLQKIRDQKDKLSTCDKGCVLLGAAAVVVPVIAAYMILDCHLNPDTCIGGAFSF